MNMLIYLNKNVIKININYRSKKKEMIDQYYETEIAINKIIEQLKSIPHHTSSVFFMGESGSGKGTLINYLIRNPYLRADVSLTGEMIIKSERKNSDQDE